MANLEKLQARYKNLTVNRDTAWVRFVTVAAVAGAAWALGAPQFALGAATVGLVEAIYTKNKRDAVQKQILSTPPPAPKQ